METTKIPTKEHIDRITSDVRCGKPVYITTSSYGSRPDCEKMFEIYMMEEILDIRVIDIDKVSFPDDIPRTERICCMLTYDTSFVSNPIVYHVKDNPTGIRYQAIDFNMGSYAVGSYIENLKYSYEKIKQYCIDDNKGFFLHGVQANPIPVLKNIVSMIKVEEPEYFL
jgi:hypothetical protein